MANFYRSFFFYSHSWLPDFREVWVDERDICQGWRGRKNLKRIYCADHHKNIPDFNISTFLALAQMKNFFPPTNSGKDFHSPIMRWYSPSAGCCCRSNNPHYQQQLSSSLLSLPVDFRFYILLRASSTSQHTAQALSYFSYHLIIIAVCTIASFQIHITRWTCRECSTTYVDVIFD